MDSTTKSIVRISLDLETASLENNAAIVQIGACVIGESEFLSSPRKVFNQYIDLASCERLGLHVDKGTMEWWSQQDPVLRAKVFSGTRNITQSLTDFIGWMYELCGGDWTRLRVYSKGPEDWIWLKEACYAALGSFPLHYRTPQSVRTIQDIADHKKISLDQIVNVEKHDALADAIYQAKLVEKVLGL